MNKWLEQYARNWIKANLSVCTEAEQTKFRWMYGKKGSGTKSINEIVDEMETSTLDWAMTQIYNTLIKRRRK